jgi:hypothetical protein
MGLAGRGDLLTERLDGSRCRRGERVAVQRALDLRVPSEQDPGDRQRQHDRGREEAAEKVQPPQQRPESAVTRGHSR